jgi:hypothetical protein
MLGLAVAKGSLSCHLSDRRPRRGLVDDRLFGGKGGHQGLNGQVVDGPGQSPRYLVDKGQGVVGEQRVGPPGEPGSRRRGVHQTFKSVL